jgi:hypothetical protein
MGVKSFDQFLEIKFSGSRRKAYYLMSIHEHLPPQARKELKKVGWAKGIELAKLARRDNQHFDCATWLHKAKHSSKEEFHQAVEKELTGKITEPWEIVYFKLYESQIPIIDRALETAALMLGSDRSRGYCLEMICADFLAGANLDSGDPETLLFSMTRFFQFLSKDQKDRFLTKIGEPGLKVDAWKCTVVASIAQLGKLSEERYCGAMAGVANIVAAWRTWKCITNNTAASQAMILNWTLSRCAETAMLDSTLVPARLQNSSDNKNLFGGLIVLRRSVFAFGGSDRHYRCQSLIPNANMRRSEHRVLETIGLGGMALIRPKTSCLPVLSSWDFCPENVAHDPGALPLRAWARFLCSFRLENSTLQAYMLITSEVRIEWGKMDIPQNSRWKTRLVERGFPDRSFEIEFWQEQGDEAIFAAA